MIKAEINLLPPVVKRERFSRLVWHQLARLYWWVVLIVMAMTVALGASWAVLHQMNQRLQAAAAQPSEQAEGTTAVRGLNQLIRAMQSRVTSEAPWGPAVAAVLTVVPPELKLTDLTVAADKQQLVIEGTSANRAAVATLEERLKALDWVEKVEAPLTNLVLGREGAFSFTLQRKAGAP